MHLLFPLPIDASYKITPLLAMQFQRRSLNIIVIYMYIAQGWGQTTHGDQIF